jgi:hypothetical protein
MTEKSSNGVRYKSRRLFLFLSFFMFQLKVDILFQVTTSIYNLILGKLYCDHYGTMRLEGNCGYSCKLKFKEQSIIDRNPHQVRAFFLSRMIVQMTSVMFIQT